MTKETKIVTTVAMVTIILISTISYLAVKSSPSESNGNVPTANQILADAGQMVRSDNYYQGQKEAKVTVVEFADYQCPACKLAYPQIKQLEEIYANQNVKFVFRNFPLQSHRNTLVAHNAAEAAGKQGKFWEMHGKLFENQEEWSADGPTPKTRAQAEEIILGYAKDLGLDTVTVKQAINENTYNQVFSRDLADGEKLGVTATPTIFVNGKKIKYVGELKSAIETELAL